MDPKTPEQIRRELEDRGVPPDLADAVATRIAPHLVTLDDAARRGFLTGVVTAYGVHREGFDGVEKSVRDIGEMQQLMNDFGDELRKLDEALEVLAAYVVRMRSRSDPDDRLLH